MEEYLKELLTKYVCHVAHHEGIDFLHKNYGGPYLTDQEMTKIKSIVEETEPLLYSDQSDSKTS
jgi:hypothetical protein